MKIICTKAEFAALVRNCANGECSKCALADACITYDNGKLETCEEEPATAEDLVSEIIMEDKNA